ncbi:MAG: alpha/beta hydrolase [Methyloceanibacter sp.]|uniref:alpha/beta hydrolase n=1 Tax=Methyloceanibacter sp. TaxID=1965321 RepID=UPI003D6D7DF4
MLNLLFALVGIFALFCIVARLLHRYFVYVPDPTRVAPKDAGLTGVDEIVFKAADGTLLIAWYSPARDGKPTLLYFGGNSGNAAYRAGKIKMMAADGYGVFLLNYRRYGGSGGRPTEKRVAADAVSAYDYLRGLGVAPHDIVLYGESLGTAVATRLALQREVKALVLEAPFTSVVDVGRLMWPLLPLNLIMVDQYRTIDRIGQVEVPLFIIHGGRDNVIPLDHARRVFHAANEPKALCVVPRAGHSDVFEQGAWGKVRDFLVSLEPVPVVVAPVARAGLQVEIAAAADANR